MTDLKKWEENNHWIELDLRLCGTSGEYVNMCPVRVYHIIDGTIDAENILTYIECGVCQ
jgi:ferredoxin-like protein FixX